MSFPTLPSNGATTQVNGITYIYSSTTNSWTRQLQSFGNLSLAGNLTADKVYTIQGLYWAGNNVSVSGGINMVTDTNPPPDPVVGDQWYDPSLGILFEYLDDGDSSQWIDITSGAISANSVINLATGDLSVLGSVSPGLNDSYDLGNVNYAWHNVYSTGTSILGNISTTHGIFWANGTPAFYSNVLTAQYLPVHTGNLAAGNANVNGKITTTSGLFWSNGTPYTAGRQSTSYSMNMIFGI